MFSNHNLCETFQYSEFITHTCMYMHGKFSYNVEHEISSKITTIKLIYKNYLLMPNICFEDNNSHNKHSRTHSFHI